MTILVLLAIQLVLALVRRRIYLITETLSYTETPTLFRIHFWAIVVLMVVSLVLICLFHFGKLNVDYQISNTAIPRDNGK